MSDHPLIIPSSTSIPLRQSYNDMSFLQSFSRFRKKAKDKVSNIRNRIKGRGTNVDGEGLVHSALYLQSEPAIVVGSELGGDTGVGAGHDDPRPADSLPVSRSTGELEHEPGGSDDYIARREHDQKGLHPHAYERAGRGSSQERMGADGKRAGHVDPPRSESDIARKTPTPSILQDDKSEST